MHGYIPPRLPLRDRINNRLWDIAAKVRHWFGRHTMIPVEIWKDSQLVGYNGALCWLCDQWWMHE